MFRFPGLPPSLPQMMPGTQPGIAILPNLNQILEAERTARQARDAALRAMCNAPSVQEESLRNLARRALTFASQMFGVTPRNEERPGVMQQVINYVLLVNSRFNACVEESQAEARGQTTAARYARQAAAIGARVFNLTAANNPRLSLSFEVLLEMQSRMRALGLSCLNFLTSILGLPPGVAGEVCTRTNNLTNTPGGGISINVPRDFFFSDALIRLGRDAPGVLIQQPATPTSVQLPSIAIAPPIR